MIDLSSNRPSKSVKTDQAKWTKIAIQHATVAGAIPFWASLRRLRPQTKRLTPTPLDVGPTSAC